MSHYWQSYHHAWEAVYLQIKITRNNGLFQGSWKVTKLLYETDAKVVLAQLEMGE